MKNRLLLVALLVSSVLSLAAQNTCTIFGVAEGREGHVIGIYRYDDFITYTEEKLAEGIVGDSGKFSLAIEVNEVSYVMIRCKNVHGFVYAEPGRNVEVIFPDRDPKTHVNPDVDYELPVPVYISDSTDMNFLVEDYNERFNLWWSGNPNDSLDKGHYHEFVAKGSMAVLDTFRMELKRHYAWVKNPYFHPWMEYGFASMEDATFHSQVKTAQKYIVGRPVYYHNTEYMAFFNNFFHDYLYKWSARKEGQGIQVAINQLGSYDSLLSTMKRLPWLQSDTLRELVMLKGLFEVYNNPAFNPRNVLFIAQQASSRSRIAEHRRIARNIVTFYTKLKAGTPAPHFTGVNIRGADMDPLEAYKGKYVYLFFYATWNTHSMSEFRYMADLQKKYGKKIVFVSVSLDPDTNAWKAFVKANPKYNWAMLHYDYKEKTKTDYNLYTVPAGYIIDPDGKLYVSPADNPSGDLEYNLYRIANPKAPPYTKPGER